VGTVLIVVGVAVVALAGWRGFTAVRVAVGPLVHDGDPTRSLIEATRPVHERSRIRAFARGVTLSVGWLIVALYGLFLVAAGMSAASR
jgi:hypothetical protein